MNASLQSLIDCGTKLWLDSVDPASVRENFALGATGATSNPIIISGIVQAGGLDESITRLAAGMDDEELAWALCDELVGAAQKVFRPVFDRTRGNDGYVSFELDPLLEDPAGGPPHELRVARYVELGRHWSARQENRMIKVPATPAGLAALEDLAAAGVPLNVTLIFSERQYRAARDAIWRGARRRQTLGRFKSVYSIFVSRLDVYTEKHAAALSPAAQGQVGIVNAKRIWKQNQEFWADKGTPLRQEMVFASTGTKKPQDEKDKYVSAFAGSDIQTNPPETNDWVAKSGRSYSRRIDEMPAAEVLAEIDRVVDMEHLEETLMKEGLEKFAKPQKDLIERIGKKRASLGR
jgi:transaldolase